MTDLGHWQLTASSGSLPVGAKGFIYEITNELTGRKYIGKKNLISKTSRKVTGRIRRVHTTKDSDWRTYTGSCKPLNKDIDEFGKDNFTFVILEFCMSAKELRWAEVETIWRVGALKADRKYYNEAADSLRYSEPKWHPKSSRSRW